MTYRMVINYSIRSDGCATPCHVLSVFLILPHFFCIYRDDPRRPLRAKGGGGGVQRRREHRISGARWGDADRRHPVEHRPAPLGYRDMRRGRGAVPRTATVTSAKVRAAVERVIREASFTQTARRVAASFAGFDPHARFHAVIEEVISRAGTANETIRSTAP
jgi:hypothetical protein